MNDLINKITGSWIESEDIHSDCLFVRGQYIEEFINKTYFLLLLQLIIIGNLNRYFFITSSLEVWISSSGYPVSSSEQLLKL